MRKWGKRLAATLAIAGGGLLVLALLAPLVLRGKRLAAVVERATSSLCGTIRVEGGRFGVTAVFDLLLGRLTFVELEGVRVVAPDGEEVLSAAQVAARLRVRSNPLRVDVHDLRLRSVGWSFVEHRGEGRVDFIDVFRQVPAGASREVCISRRPRSPAGPPAPTPPRPAPARRPPPEVRLQVHNVTLDDVHLRLDFSTWGLDLAGISAQGGIAFSSGAAGPLLTFEARGLEARRGGTLRIGQRGQRWAAIIPFEHVQIDRFSTLPDAPADMLLEVGRASTGRSKLSGRARFTDIFPWKRRSRWSGMELDARWAEVGDAVEALKQVWGLNRRLPGRLDGDLSARLQGPFEALAGRVQAIGPRAHFEVGLDRELRVDASLQLDEVETDGVLDRSLAPLLAGRLSGRLRAHGQLARRILDMSATIDEATLRLDRSRRGPWPRRFNVSTRALPGTPMTDELDVFFKGAGFAAGVLSMSELRASLPGAALRGSMSARLFDATTGRQLEAPIFAARASARDVDLARLVPGGVLRGHLSLRGEVHGPSDALSMVVTFPPGAALQVMTQALALPSRFEARLFDGDRLVLPAFRLGDPAEGAIEAAGTLVFDGPIDARLGILRYPIEKLAEGLPVRLSGRVDSGLRVAGDLRRPRVDGQIAFSAVRVNGTLLGDGAITFVPEGRSTRFSGRLVPSLGIDGRFTHAPRPALSAVVDIHDFPLATVLAEVPGLTGQVSGRAEVRAGARALDAAIDLETLALAYRVPRSEIEVALRNSAPAHLRVRDAGRTVVLAPVPFTGTGLDAVVEARREGGEVSASLKAQLALASLGPLAHPWVKEAAGIIDLTLRAQGRARAPALSGELSVHESLRVWPSALLVPVEIPRGRLSFRDDALTVERLALAIATVGLQIDGGARLDRGGLGRSTLDLRLTGAVDGAALARRLPQLLDEAHGHAALAGRLGGTLAAPTFDGTVDFRAFGLTLLGAPLVLRSLDGRIDAQGHTLSTRSLVAQLGPSGRLQIGALDAPATIVIASLDPPEIASLSARVSGQDIATAGPISGVRLQDLDLRLSVEHARGGPLRVSGDVWIADATLLPTELRPPPRAPRLRAAGARVAREFFPEVTLDVGLHAPDGGLEVVVPYLPDIEVTLDCRVVGPLRRPKVGGRAHGDGLYSWLAVYLYDLFSDVHVRRCGAR